MRRSPLTDLQWCEIGREWLVARASGGHLNDFAASRGLNFSSTKNALKRLGFRTMHIRKVDVA